MAKKKDDPTARALQAILKAHGPVKLKSGLVRCRVCRCTETEPCAVACWWQEDDLRGDICSTCAEAAYAINLWFEVALRPNWAALIREAQRLAYDTPVPYRTTGKAVS